MTPQLSKGSHWACIRGLFLLVSSLKSSCAGALLNPLSPVLLHEESFRLVICQVWEQWWTMESSLYGVGRGGARRFLHLPCIVLSLKRQLTN